MLFGLPVPATVFCWLEAVSDLIMYNKNERVYEDFSDSDTQQIRKQNVPLFKKVVLMQVRRKYR